jgi:hypothetical protein
MVSHHWSPIADLPDDWEGFARPDLDQMLRLWNQEREHLAAPDRVAQLQERLATLWAIETGVIERLYMIDRGTTESLVEQCVEGNPTPDPSPLRWRGEAHGGLDILASRSGEDRTCNSKISPLSIAMGRGRGWGFPVFSSRGLGCP